MIPHNLITKIEQGEAEFKTYAAGGSSAILLPVPEDRYIVIIGFTYNHFTDQPFVGPPVAMVNALSKSWHQLTFRSEKSVNKFIIKNDINITGFDAANRLANVVGHTHEKDLYLVHESDVSIEIVVMDVNNVNRQFFDVPSNWPSVPYPVGVKQPTGLPQIQQTGKIETFGPNEWKPYAKFLTPTPGERSDNQVYWPMDTTSRLSEDRDFDPFINIKYVEVNAVPTQKIKSSS